MRPFPLLLAVVLSGCAGQAPGTSSPSAAPPSPASGEAVLIVEATVAGDRLMPTPETGYYLVLDTDGDPADGPRINGPAPQQYPYPDPRSYLPFVRDEEAFLDREPVPVPPSSWDRYFVLTEEAGRPVVWQGVRRPDGTVDERARALQRGTDWELVEGKTWRLTLPFPRRDPATGLPAQWEANVATARIGSFSHSGEAVIDAWGQGPSQFFPILTRPGTQTVYDTLGGVAFPQNVPEGVEPGGYDWVTVTTRVLELGGPPGSRAARQY